MARTTAVDEQSDTELVQAALGGDRDAFGAVYDRYGNVIYTVCVRMLGQRDEAADCAADVFLKAAERLHQLREPAKLKAWLYAITRNEVNGRLRRRGREVLVDAVDDRAWTPSPLVPDDLSIRTDTASLPAATMGTLLREATAGLTDRDRMVAELGLQQGLQGDDLAAALGVTTNHAYVLVHRVRNRLERSVTAILVARHGREDCRELEGILAGWDGDLTVVLRKRVARHVDRCDICGRRRALVPAALFNAAPVLAAPLAVRQRVLEGAPVASTNAQPWSRSGFPSKTRGRWPALLGVAAVVVALVLVLGALGLARSRDELVTAAAGGPTATAAASTTTIDPRGLTPGSLLSDLPALAAPGTTVVDLDAVPGPDGAVATTVPGSPTPTSPAGPGPFASTTVPPVAGGGNGGGGSGGGGGDGGGNPAPPPAPAPPTPGSLDPSPASLAFGPSSVAQQLTLTNTGGTPLPFTLTSGNAAVAVVPANGSVAPGASQPVTVTLTRTGLAEGAFGTQLALATSAGNAAVPVSAQINVPPVIVSFDGPASFGPAPAANCAFDVVVTDTTGVDSVVVEWRLSTGGGSSTKVLMPTAGHYRGTQTVTAGPGTVLWRVVATDTLGNVATTAEQTTPRGSVCTL